MDLEKFSEQEKYLFSWQVDNISHWDSKKKEFVPVNIKLSHDYITISPFNGDYNPFFREITSGISLSEGELIKCSIKPSESLSDNSVVVINDSSEATFIMPKQKCEYVLRYITRLNELTLEKDVNYLSKYEINFTTMLNKLVNVHKELVEITANFIEKQPRGRVTNLRSLMAQNDYLLKLSPGKYNALRLASPNTIKYFDYSTKENYQLENVNLFFEEDFRYFLKLLQEREGNIDLFVAYKYFVIQLVDYYSNKWMVEHAVSFEKINDMNLKSIAEKYCLLDNVNVLDPETQGEFFYFLIKNGKFGFEKNMFDNVGEYHTLIRHEFDEKKFSNFKNRLKSEQREKVYSIDDVDLMDGVEFENFLAFLFSKMGYKAEVTKASGDQGIDIVAEKNDGRIGIQAKCYSGVVGNSAVQEAQAGKAFYKLDKVIVITNNVYTGSAIQLAQANGVVLWDRNLLKEKITEILGTAASGN